MGSVWFNIFDTSGFVPRWYCGNWTPQLGWLHVLADAAVFGAYTAIPCVLVYFTLRRQDVPFNAIFWLFGAFILSCGVTHLIEAGLFWWPAYRLSGAAKLVTALVSWMTVFALVQIMPEALRLPGLARLNTDLRRANNDLKDFADVVSHDLKSPLRGLRSLTDWMEADAPELNEQARAHLRQMRTQIDKMDGLINGVLLYSQVGRGSVEPREVDTGALVQHIVRSLPIPAGISVVVEAGLPVLRHDEPQLVQVFQNLIDNAVRHMGGESGAITISCRECSSGWEFCVRDTGPGIPPEHHERIFRMFQRLSASSGGLGIGLAVAKRTVEFHGGKIWVDSAPGRGASFYFTVPKRIHFAPAVEQEVQA